MKALLLGCGSCRAPRPSWLSGQVIPVPYWLNFLPLAGEHQADFGKVD